MANGCIENSFLDVSELLSTLQNHSFEESHPSIPFGTKNNVFFVVQNNQNCDQRSKGKKSAFSDDCGAWNSNSRCTPKTYYVKSESGEYKNVFLKNGSFCSQKKLKASGSMCPLPPSRKQFSHYLGIIQL